jgi:hypothetical protein
VEFLETLKNTLHLQNEKEWMKFITYKDIVKNGGEGLLRRFGSINNLHKSIPELYMNHDSISLRTWSHIKVIERKGQSMLSQLVESIFPLPWIGNYPLPVEGQRPFELDVYIPSLHLAFEYQGEQHYKPTVFGNRTAVKIQQERVGSST